MDKIIIIGTNDIATACAVRLFRCGFPVCVVSNSIPFDIFHFRNYSSVFPLGSKIVNGVKALTYADFIYHNTDMDELSLTEFTDFSFQNRQIPVLSEEDINKFDQKIFKFCVVTEIELYKTITFHSSDCTIISALENKQDLIVNYSIYTDRYLTGLVDYPFLDYPEIEEPPTSISQFAISEGVFISEKFPGDQVSKNDHIGTQSKTPIVAVQSGYISGLMRSGIFVSQGEELVRIETRKKAQDVKLLPFESFAVAGGVLEAIMYHKKYNPGKNHG